MAIVTSIREANRKPNKERTEWIYSYYVTLESYPLGKKWFFSSYSKAQKFYGILTSFKIATREKILKGLIKVEFLYNAIK
jgi:hypothetical protein